MLQNLFIVIDTNGGEFICEDKINNLKVNFSVIEITKKIPKSFITCGYSETKNQEKKKDERNNRKEFQDIWILTN